MFGTFLLTYLILNIGIIVKLRLKRSAKFVDEAASEEEVTTYQPIFPVNNIKEYVNDLLVSISAKLILSDHSRRQRAYYISTYYCRKGLAQVTAITHPVIQTMALPAGGAAAAPQPVKFPITIRYGHDHVLSCDFMI